MEMLEDRQTKGFGATGAGVGLEKRISFLEQSDRQFLAVMMRGTLTHRQASELLGMAPGTITRRLRRLMARLNDPLVVALVENGALLPEGYRDVGLAYFLRGMTAIQISRAAGVSVYEVKRELEYVRGWHGGKRVKTRRMIV